MFNPHIFFSKSLAKVQYIQTHIVFQENFNKKTIRFNWYCLLRNFDQKRIQSYSLHHLFGKIWTKDNTKDKLWPDDNSVHLKLDLKNNVIKRLMILWFKLLFKKILIKSFYGLTHIVCKNFILSNSTAIQSILLFQNSLIKR